jgi:O-antigen ligase
MNTAFVGRNATWLGRRRPVNGRAILSAAVAVGLAVGLFRLALGDGGRDGRTLAAVEVLVFAISAGIVALGAVHTSPVLRALGGVVFVAVFTTIWSIRPDSSLREILLWATYLGIFLIVSTVLTGSRSARRFLDGILVIGGWLCLIGLYLYWGAGNPRLRWYSTFYAPNAFAAFLLLMVPLAATRCCLAQSRREAFDCGAITVLLATALIMTASRGAYLALALAAMMAVPIVRPASWRTAVRRALTVAALTAFAVVILTHASGAVIERTASLLDSGNSSVQDRLSFWHSGVRIFLDHPVVGTGAGTFAYAHGKYMGRYYAQDAHNLYVQRIAETGLAGMAALAWLLASLGALWIRTLRKAKGSEEYALVAGTGLSVAAFFLHSAVEMSWQFPANPAVAFAMAGVLGWRDRWPDNAGERPAGTLRHPAIRILLVVVLLAAVAGVLLLRTADQEFLKGRRLAGSGQWTGASRQFERAMTLNPLDPRFPSAQAVAFQRLAKDPDNAMRLIQRSAALDRMNAYYQLQWAEVLLPGIQESSVRREVERLLRQALDLDPFHYPEAYGRLAHVYKQEGRAADAWAVYTRAVAIYAPRPVASDMVLRVRLWPRVAALLSEAAAFRAAQGWTDDAVRVLDVLVGQDPLWQPAYMQMADLYLQEGRVGDAAYAVVAGWAERPERLALSPRPSRLSIVFPRAYPR